MDWTGLDELQSDALDDLSALHGVVTTIKMLDEGEYNAYMLRLNTDMSILSLRNPADMSGQFAFLPTNHDDDPPEAEPEHPEHIDGEVIEDEAEVDSEVLVES